MSINKINHQKRLNSSSGFTLVEMLVIAPIALLVISGFIVLMVAMVGDVIVNHSRNMMTHDIQGAINMIEQDIRLSTEFVPNSGTMSSPQGKDGVTSPFQMDDGDLILGVIATDKNPIDPDRRFVYYSDAPYDCSHNELYKNRIKFLQVIYYVKNDSLWRRTVIDNSDYSNLCETPWQVNSCSPGYSSSDTRCVTSDSEIVEDIANFDIKYFLNPDDVDPLDSDFNEASTIQVSLTGRKDPAGRQITVSASTRGTKLDSREINLAAPVAPTVDYDIDVRTITFAWDAVPDATSYAIEYNTNGGDWVTATESTTANSFIISGQHTDTISVRVRARNTTGLSPIGDRAATIPLWVPCDLQSQWVNYGSGYAPCEYTMTRDGIIAIQGTIKDGRRGDDFGTNSNGYTSIPLFRLPEEYRPPEQHTVSAIAYSNGTANSSVRISVNPSGTVYLVDDDESTGNQYLSLSGIQFIPQNTFYQWSNISTQNGWSNYTDTFAGKTARLSSTKDNSGRVHLKGSIINLHGGYNMGTVMGQLPSDSRPSQYHHFPIRSSPSTPGIANVIGIQQDSRGGNIVARGIDHTSSGGGNYVGIKGLFYPAGHTGWSSSSWLAGSWSNYGSDAGGDYTTASHTKADDNMVTVKGTIRGGSNGTVIGTLPAGSRPSGRIIITVPAHSQPAARVDVLPNGQIIAVANTSSTWTAINFSFMAAP